MITGDYSGDGIGDLAVTAYGHASRGLHAIHFFEGPISSDRSMDEADANRSTDLQISRYGLASGDLDGDGYHDLLAGSTNYGGDVASEAIGVVWLFRGPITGAGDVSLADATILGERAPHGVGDAIDATGDVDGDGKGDILIGSSYYSDSGVPLGGAAWLVSGAPSGTVDLSTYTARLLGRRECGRAGHAVAGGDTNGDGVGDLIVGAPSLYDSSCGDNAYASVVRGPVEDNLWLSGADVDIGFQGGSGVMWLDSGVDFDDDGRDDLLVADGIQAWLFTGL